MEAYSAELSNCLSEEKELQLLRKDYDVCKKRNEDSFIPGSSTVHKDQISTDGSDSHQIVCSLPEFLTVRQSGAGYRIWSKTEIPEGVVFGPYEGVVYDSEENRQSTYSWEVGKRRRKTQFVDAENEFHSNWLRYVNYACTEDEQNLIAYQYDEQIYYHTSKAIPPQTELLVWYGSVYANEVGLDWEMGEKKKCKNQISSSIRIFGLIHMCDVCNEECATDERVEARMQFHSISRHFICNKRLLNRQIQRKLFLSDNISEKKFTKNTKQKLKIHQGIHTGEKPFSCQFCKKSFITNGDLKVHQRIHTGEKPFSCDVCKRKFNQYGHLRVHQRLHTGDKPFLCNICKRKFNQNVHLRIHQRIHTGEKPFSCQFCKKSFIMNGDLKVHQRIHTGEKPFSCQLCKKSFITNGDLKVHQRIHTGEKPYSCQFCKKSFITNGDLKVHQRIHTGEKPFSCQFCKKSFITNGDLNVHQRIHTGEKPFSCDVCKRKFNQYGHLRVHQRLHTGDKPFLCDICKRKFNQNVHLRIHQRLHTGEKPFSCDICKKEFITIGNLKRHQRIHR